MGFDSQNGPEFTTLSDYKVLREFWRSVGIEFLDCSIFGIFPAVSAGFAFEITQLAFFGTTSLASWKR